MMSKNGKKGFIETLLVTFAKHTLVGIKKSQTKSLNVTVDNRIAKLLDRNGNIKIISAYDIKKGNIVIVENGDIIPVDGEVIEGLALVDESAITGESVPVIKEAGGDFRLVIRGTRVVNNWLKIKVANTPTESYQDKRFISEDCNAI
jgi:potassium-transporting ATPase ATP-binding subunit